MVSVKKLPEHLEVPKRILEEEGYVVVKARTYRNLQEKVRALKAQLDWEAAATASAEQWGRDAHVEQRRLVDRIVFVYGEARAAGCSVEQLAGGA